MKTEFQAVSPLIHAAEIRPASRRLVALALAHIHQTNEGQIAISMAQLSDMVGMSAAQTRKRLHSLIALGVLEVTANAHGGAPGSVPHYQFNLARLQVLATRKGCTADMFDSQQRHAPTHHFLSEGGARMVAQLAGRPGDRCVQFFRESDEGLQDFGQVPLSQLLLPWRLKGCWDAVLYQETREEDISLEEIFPGEFEMLQQWAQQAALGRVESVVEA